MIFRSTGGKIIRMTETSSTLGIVLDELTHRARLRGLTDARWARRAGMSKETLCRLRRRRSCQLSTLTRLASVVGVRLGLLDDSVPVEGHFPDRVSREHEERLFRLCAARPLEPKRWAAAGPRFFVAGLAVMTACAAGVDRRDADRRDLLNLAERLSPGASQPDVFARWLKRSPVRPSRFLPMLDMYEKHAA